MRRIITGLISASFIAGTLALPVSAESVTYAAVSGYVSMTAQTGSVELVSENKTPVIHIDESDYKGVIRAANDLVSDIETVTGKEPTLNNDDITIEAAPGGSGITMNGDGMSITVDYPLPNDSQSYVAVYNADKTLAGVKMSTGKIGDEVITGFTFDEKLTKPAGGEIKAFIWCDMEPVTGVLGMLAGDDVDLNGIDVVIGTLGESETVDTLAASGKLDVSEIKGKWESFTIQNVDDTIIIAGSDKRGTIYGIYDLSEKIGVSPWHFWADTVIGHADALYVNLPAEGYMEGEPSVKYRGIFLNDEYNMSEWSKSMSTTGKNMNNETYEKIFELLLRLKANYLWPAMHTYSEAFNNTENNAKLADEYGIVMGSSHCEPILRNNLGELYNFQQEWVAANPDKKLYINATDDEKHKVSWMWTDTDGTNYVDNKEFLRDYWRARAKANGGYENTYTLGMRGVHDGSFSTNMNSKTAMNEIIAAQREVLKDEVVTDGKTISDVPQIFIPYKDVLNLYNQGLEVPDDVTLMWPDDNFGYIRQLPTEAEAKRSGGAGIYYHLSYYGNPTSYIWLGTTQPGLIREEMTKAYDMNAKEIWVANVGDLKPAETEIEYFMDLAKDVGSVRNEDIADRLAKNAKRDFGFNDAQAEEYADIKIEYYELANSRRPEHMAQGLFSLTDFGDEGQTLLDRYQAIEDRAQVLYDGLAADKQPSFYELMLYPIKSAHNMAANYVYADKAQYYVDNGYGAAANKYTALSNAANSQIDTDTKEYNSMLNGKWNKIMNPRQTRLNLSVAGGTIKGVTSSATVSAVPYTTMTIVPEGGGDLSFHEMNMRAKFIDIINSGSGTFDWKATPSDDWIVLNKYNDTVADNDRIYVGIDESKKPTADSEGTITFERLVGDVAVDTYTVAVSFETADAVTEADTYYYEADGYVSIEAEHYTKSVTNGVYEWKIEKDFGRSGDSVKIYPNRAATVTNPNKDNSAYLEYKVYFENSGTFSIDVYRMPTINELSGATLRCRIGIDDAAPVQFNGNTVTTDKSTGADAWGKGVLQNTQIISGTITVPSAGIHTIRLYNESSGVVIDKFVITTGEKKASYYGAPESYNSVYNVISPNLPAASTPAQEQTGTFKNVYEPKAVIGIIKRSDDNIIVPLYTLDASTENAVVAVTGYDDKGFMTMCDIKKVTFSDGKAEAKLMLSADANNYAVTVFDNFTDLHPIAPYKEFGDIVITSSSDSISVTSDLSGYMGKQSIVLIADAEINEEITAENIKYLRAETLTGTSYKNIPFEFAQGSKYAVRIGIDGENAINENINILPDNIGELSALYGEDFENTDPTSFKWNGTSTAVSYAADHSKYLKYTAGTSTIGAWTAIDPGKRIGSTVTVKADLKFTSPSGTAGNSQFTISSNDPKFDSNNINYGIKAESDGHILAFEYNGGKTLKVNGTEITTGFIGDWMHVTAEINFVTKTINLTLTSDKANVETLTFDSMSFFSSNTITDIGSIYLRAAKSNATVSLDNFGVYESAAPKYAIDIIPVDADDKSKIEGAQVTVTDADENVIAAEENGKYMLGEGEYTISVIAPGYEDVSTHFTIDSAIESKTVEIEMTALSVSQHAVTFDSEGGSVVSKQYVADI